MLILGPIDYNTWRSEAKNWNYGCQIGFVTHHWHPCWVINFLSLLPGTAEGGWRRQSCVTLTLAPKLFFFKGLMRVIRKIEMREMNFCSAVIAQNFFLIFYLCKIGRKLHKEHSFWKEKRISMSLDGIFLWRFRVWRSLSKMSLRPILVTPTPWVNSPSHSCVRSFPSSPTHPSWTRQTSQRTPKPGPGTSCPDAKMAASVHIQTQQELR